ncbi:MAG: hypothetical protein WDL87_09415 [Candidatus Omnitrophota bacterium]|jgi:hypothetical protein
MSILTRAILLNVLLIFPVFSPAYPASSDSQEPIAQVYEVQGKATVKNSADGIIREVRKGCLLGVDDSLTLDRNALIALYFKNGGKKEVRAKDTQVLHKVSDLLPKAEAYGQSVPLFGATRGINIPEAVSQTAGFFYPQEAIILDSPPLIEFTLFNGPGEEVVLGGALVQIAKGGVVFDSKKFNSLEYGSVYAYQSPKLNVQTEYSVEIRYELQKALGSVMTISFPLYIAGTSDTASGSKYSPFSDSVYRSFESSSTDYKGKKRAITALKQLVRRSGSPVPVIVIELFIL